MDDYLSYTKEFVRAISIAQSLAKEYRNEHFTAYHLLKALLHDEIGLLPLIESLEKDVHYLRDWADFGIENIPKSTNTKEDISGDEGIKKLLGEADLTRIKLSKDKLDPLCALLALLKPGIALSAEKLKSLPLTHAEVLETVLNRSTIEQAIDTPQKGIATGKKSIYKYCVDKTELAREAKLDPVVGRDDEIQKACEKLGRRLKNNVLILGEPGVGKTAIVDGLAQKVNDGTVPSFLKGTVILELDLKALIAGATYKGEFEDRLKNVLNDVKEIPKAILFIDEIHALIESGGGSGPSVGDLLKPELSRGALTIIGTTTLEEYRKKIEPDRALVRRFDQLIIEEPDEVIALEMLKGVMPKYEEHHKLSITDTALKESIRLSKRYIKDNWLPDSAIDLIDRAFSFVKISNESSKKSTKKKVESEDIAKVISQQTGIPLGRLQMQEREKLLNIEDHLKKRVVGQDHVLSLIAEAIRESRSGLAVEGKPIGAFFLLGPTGTGKTETAKTLAEFLFDDDQALLRFDMSEFKEEHSAALLYGAPPGYVGYKEGGLLVNKIREKPYSVVLFDEIEKAHRSVFDLFLQILDEGKLHDKLGKVGDFSNAVVLFTSNIGSKWIMGEIEKGEIPNTQKCQEVMGQYFRPEFLGRLTDILPFKPLTEKSMEGIFRIHIKSLEESLKAQKIKLEITKEARKQLLQDSFSPEFGARPLIGVIRNQLRRPLSKLIISGEIKANKKATLQLDEDNNFIWKSN